MYLSSECGKVCPGWEDPENFYKEEYKQEVADNHLYYGNKDVSQEDIFFEKNERQRKKPQFILPSYQCLSPTKSISKRGPKPKSDPGDLADLGDSLFSGASSEPDSPAPKSPTSPNSTIESVDNEVHHPYAVYTSRHEPWKKRQPKGHGKTIKRESDSEED